MEAYLRAKEWEPHEIDPATPLGKYIAAVTQGGGAMHISYRTFRATVEGRALTAFVAQIDLNIMDKRSTAVSCEIFDPAASGPLSRNDVRRWAGRKPTSSRSANGIILDRWLPGLTRGSDETEIIFLSPAHAFAQTRAGLTYSVTAKLTAKQQ
jgi:hypothetical protein